MEGKLEKYTQPNCISTSIAAIYVFTQICLSETRNLVDAANIAALAALSTFTRPECTFGGEDGQELIVHPPDVSFIFFYY